MKLVLISCFVILSFVTISQGTDSPYAKALIESCPGCSLNRLPEVKRFIYDDVSKYENIEFKKIHGAPPELVLFDANDAEVERIALNKLNRQECNDLLVSKGFKLKEKETIDKEL